MPDHFDVFLSHNSRDKPAVIALAKKLKAQRLKVWLDIWELRLGQPWQEALEQIIETTKTAAVLVGVDGLGPWEDVEMRACLNEFVQRKLPVVPVLLSDCPKKPDLPLLLRAFTWVDLRDGKEDEGFYNLIWGITGIRPKELDEDASFRPNSYAKANSDATTHGAAQSGRHPFFIKKPFTEFDAAIAESKLVNKPLFLIIYKDAHPTKSKLGYSLGCFLEYFETKKLVDDHFVTALVSAKSEKAANLVPQDDPLENCLWVVLNPKGDILLREGVYANPGEGLKRVRAVIAQSAYA